MPQQSAGILVFRVSKKSLKVLLVHPGGPIFGHKDDWSIPKGELDGSEDHITAAYREFQEEVGLPPPAGPLLSLGSSRQPSGKVNFIWAVEGLVDLTQFHCNNFTMEWPPRSGRIIDIPENDKADWLDISVAKTKIFASQLVFLERLQDILNPEVPPTRE